MCMLSITQSHNQYHRVTAGSDGQRRWKGRLVRDFSGQNDTKVLLFSLFVCSPRKPSRGLGTLKQTSTFPTARRRPRPDLNSFSFHLILTSDGVIRTRHFNVF